MCDNFNCLICKFNTFSFSREKGSPPPYRSAHETVGSWCDGYNVHNEGTQGCDG